MKWILWNGFHLNRKFYQSINRIHILLCVCLFVINCEKFQSMDFPHFYYWCKINVWCRIMDDGFVFFGCIHFISVCRCFIHTTMYGICFVIMCKNKWKAIDRHFYFRSYIDKYCSWDKILSLGLVEIWTWLKFSEIVIV